MNKGLIILCMIITGIAAVGVILVMILGMNGHSIFDFAPGINFRVGGGPAVLIKEESLSMSDVQKLYLDTSFYGVSVKAVSGETAVIRQYDGNEDQPFTLTRSGSDAYISTSRHNNVGLFLWYSESRIELDIPRDWIGAVDFSTSSGGIKLLDGFAWTDTVLRTSSGGITLNGPLTVDSLELRVSSGGIDIRDDLTVAGTLYAKSTSGGIKADRTIKANSVDLSVSSGSISMSGATIDTNDLRMEASSGGIKCGTAITQTFSVNTNSGSVKIGELRGNGSMKCSSGGISVEALRPDGDISVRSTSGSVRLGLPGELSFKMDVSVTSGSIDSDFPMSYTDDRRKHGSAVVGNEPYVGIDIDSSSGGVKISRI